MKINYEVLNRAIEIYGYDNQVRMLFEEIAELQNAVCKYLRGRCDKKTKNNVIEEIADVFIIIEQFKIMFDLADDSIQEAINFKMNRLSERVEKLEDSNIKQDDLIPFWSDDLPF